MEKLPESESHNKRELLEEGDYYKVLEIFEGPDGHLRKKIRLRVTPDGDGEEHYIVVTQEELRPNYWQDIPGAVEDLGPVKNGELPPVKEII